MEAPRNELELIAILAAVITQVILQIAQMFFDFRNDSKEMLIGDLRRRLDVLENEQKEANKYIKKLEEKVFELTKINSYLQGRIESLEEQQSLKEKLVVERTKQINSESAREKTK